MKKTWIVAMLAAGLVIGSLAGVQAKLPAVPPMSDADKAAKAEKDAAAKAKEGQAAAEDKAVKNYQGNMKKAGKPIPKPTPIAAAPAAPAAAAAKPADKVAKPADKAPEPAKK